MSPEVLHALAPDMLELFARKGVEGGAQIPQTGNANGVKVRRITQLLLDLVAQPVEELSVLDLACGEGVYAIEAALRGARVLAVDARSERMSHGARFAERLGLTNLKFEQNDVRKISVESHGEFDVVYFLGILYHLDVPDVFQVMEQVHGLCRGWLLIDTHISLNPLEQCSYQERVYSGTKVREHADEHSATARRAKVMASLDNTFAFHFDRSSLIRLLVDIGFTTVVECKAPLEPGKPANRITLAVKKGRPVIVSTYPWVNGRTEDEIERWLRAEQPLSFTRSPQPTGLKALFNYALRRFVNYALRRFGLEIRRVTPTNQLK
jgi:2-polyprenyl-3-methyl-5-hydroxy-6-metoxy-1,4-benzoquinol methylase